MRRLWDWLVVRHRITRLRNTGDLEAAAYANLKHLGELKRPYLTQLEEMNKIDSPEAQHQLPQIKERIWRLRNLGILDRGAYTVLESLGRQSYLTPVEFGLLRWLSEYYHVGEER